MSSQGAKFKAFRLALPGRGSDPVSARSLSIAMGWPDSRWIDLEAKTVWRQDAQLDAEHGVTETLRRTDANEDQVAECLAFIRNETDAVPHLEVAWRPGMSPVQRVGRPVGSRKGPNGRMMIPTEGDPPDGPSGPAAVLPKRAAIEAAAKGLRVLERYKADELDPAEALVQIWDLARDSVAEAGADHQPSSSQKNAA